MPLRIPPRELEDVAAHRSERLNESNYRVIVSRTSSRIAILCRQSCLLSLRKPSPDTRTEMTSRQGGLAECRAALMMREIGYVSMLGFLYLIAVGLEDRIAGRAEHAEMGCRDARK